MQIDLAWEKKPKVIFVYVKKNPFSLETPF